MTTQPTTTTRLSALRAIRAFCRQCDSEPRGAYLRCDVRDCPLWRHRMGNPQRFGKGGFARASHAHSRALNEAKTSLVAQARAKVVATDSEAKTTGKRHFTSSEWWPHGQLEYRPGERAVRAIGRHCADCCGGARQVRTSCCSPACALAPFRLGRWPRPTDAAPVPQAAALQCEEPEK